MTIEAGAKRRLADEYDAAQDRGEVPKAGGDRVSKVSKQNNAATTADIGISRKDIHEARIIRDAERAGGRAWSAPRQSRPARRRPPRALLQNFRQNAPVDSARAARGTDLGTVRHVAMQRGAPQPDI